MRTLPTRFLIIAGSLALMAGCALPPSLDPTVGFGRNVSSRGGNPAPGPSANHHNLNSSSSQPQPPASPSDTQGSAGVIAAVLPAGPVDLFGQLPTGAAPRSTPGENADNLRQVTYTAEGADADPDIDPTGKWLVYASTRHRQTSDLYLQAVNGTTVTQLTDGQSNSAMPVFSPDGKRIAFTSDRSGNWDVYLMPVDGGQPVQVTNDQATDIHPSFSPDGRFLVYCSRLPHTGQWELVVVEVEKPANKRFIGGGLFPHWSPVENKIVFQRARERGTRWFSIWTVELVNGEWVRPTEIAASSNAAAIAPHWSPDGKHIVFCTVVNPESAAKPSQADLWVVGTDGAGRANLTHSRTVNVQPVWARDGSIYFVSGRSKSGVENVWSLRPDRALSAALPAPAAAAAAPPVGGEKSAMVPEK